ncbi:hypothetical protein [Parasphingorhabdus sp.]|uniref:hypothetical protein n=1 Tax=Parasphingorhabdus sp. TaxID=2709688 RepID=UPI003A91E714
MAVLILSLSGCEKDFDEKYQDNLEKLNEAASEIEASVDQQLAEGREADTITESAKEEERLADTEAETNK